MCSHSTAIESVLYDSILTAACVVCIQASLATTLKEARGSLAKAISEK